MRAGKHEVAQDELAYGEKGGDEDEVISGWFLIPGRMTIRQDMQRLDAPGKEIYVHHRRPQSIIHQRTDNPSPVRFHQPGSACDKENENNDHGLTTVFMTSKRVEVVHFLGAQGKAGQVMSCHIKSSQVR